MSYESDAINAQAEGNTQPSNVQRSTAGQKAPGQSLKVFNGYLTLTASTTSVALYTPTTGASFWLTDFQASTDALSGANIDLQIASGTTASLVMRGSVHTLAPINMMAIESQPSATGNQPMWLLAASTASVNNSNHLWYNIYGFEEPNIGSQI